MAVPASDATDGDLSLDARQPQAAPCRARHREALRALMVEVEDDEVVDAAVDAPSALEMLIGVAEVPGDAGCEPPEVDAPVGAGAAPFGPPGRPAPMAVDTDDVAALDLLVDARE